VVLPWELLDGPDYQENAASASGNVEEKTTTKGTKGHEKEEVSRRGAESAEGELAADRWRVRTTGWAGFSRSEGQRNVTGLQDLRDLERTAGATRPLVGGFGRDITALFAQGAEDAKREWEEGRRGRKEEEKVAQRRRDRGEGGLNEVG